MGWGASLKPLQSQCGVGLAKITSASACPTPQRAQGFQCQGLGWEHPACQYRNTYTLPYPPAPAPSLAETSKDGGSAAGAQAAPCMQPYPDTPWGAMGLGQGEEGSTTRTGQTPMLCAPKHGAQLQILPRQLKRWLVVHLHTNLLFLWTAA